MVSEKGACGEDVFECANDSGLQIGRVVWNARTYGRVLQAISQSTHARCCTMHVLHGQVKASNCCSILQSQANHRIHYTILLIEIEIVAYLEIISRRICDYSF